ncbi:MAG TPA: hypoxanthine phosphoribosyltransferase [Clostridiaceae bacterium]|nr:hypoxanthine phosphoribosyltransferase [Clostridiaceae bacterium]
MSKLGKILYSEEEIQRRINHMARIIEKDYEEEEELILLVVLKGAVYFLADFTRALQKPVKIDFLSIGVKKDTEKNRIITYVKDLTLPIEGKSVLLLEDVVGTGLTLATLLQHIESFHPKSLKVLALLDNPNKRLLHLTVHYRLFTMPDTFVVGYGLDYHEEHRHLKDIHEFTLP